MNDDRRKEPPNPREPIESVDDNIKKIARPAADQSDSHPVVAATRAAQVSTPSTTMIITLYNVLLSQFYISKIIRPAARDAYGYPDIWINPDNKLSV